MQKASWRCKPPPTVTRIAQNNVANRWPHKLLTRGFPSGVRQRRCHRLSDETIQANEQIREALARWKWAHKGDMDILKTRVYCGIVVQRSFGISIHVSSLTPDAIAIPGGDADFHAVSRVIGGSCLSGSHKSWVREATLAVEHMQSRSLRDDRIG